MTRLSRRLRRFARSLSPTDRLAASVIATAAAGESERACAFARAAASAQPGSVWRQDLLISTLHHCGWSERALELCVDNATRHIRQLDLRRVPRPARTLDASRRVFLSGYFKSGSSAVLDHLRGFAGTVKWTPGGELRLIKSPGGMADLAARRARQSTLTAADLVDFYLHVVGGKLRTTPDGVYDKWRTVNRNSRNNFRSSTAYGYLRTCLECFVELVEVAEKLSEADLADHFRGYLSRALDAAASDAGADVLLIDQAVNAWRLTISRFAPPSTFVIVHRDPRDQFVDANAVLRQPGRRAGSAAEYAAGYRKKRLSVTSAIAEIGQWYGHRAIPVSFEDYVYDHAATAGGLADALGLTGRPYRRGWFDPRRARASVGKHVGRLSRAEAAVLERTLPEYLDHRAGLGRPDA